MLNVSICNKTTGEGTGRGFYKNKKRAIWYVFRIYYKLTINLPIDLPIQLHHFIIVITIFKNDHTKSSSSTVTTTTTAASSSSSSATKRKSKIKSQINIIKIITKR